MNMLPVLFLLVGFVVLFVFFRLRGLLRYATLAAVLVCLYFFLVSGQLLS